MMSVLVYLAFVLIIAVLVAIFAAQNSSPVDVFFLLWNMSDIPLFIIVVGAFTTGVFFSFFLGLARQIKDVIRVREMNSANHLLTLEVDRLNEEMKKNSLTKKPDPFNG